MLLGILIKEIAINEYPNVIASIRKGIALPTPKRNPHSAGPTSGENDAITSLNVAELVICRSPTIVTETAVSDI